MTKTKLPKEQWFDEDVPSDSPAIDELRTLQKETGYESPRALKEEREKEQLKKKKAGKKSALVRKELAELRMKMVKRAYDQLDPKYKTRPYSKDSIDALCEQFLVVLGIKRDSRPPPTEDEIRSFALDIEDILQLPEDVRMDVLKDEFYAFVHNTASPWKPIGDDAPKALTASPGKLIGDDAPKALLQDLSDIDLLVAARSPAWGFEKRLAQASRATLTDCLKLLGIKGKRQPRRSR
jgi:hypothetical protein